MGGSGSGVRLNRGTAKAKGGGAVRTLKVARVRDDGGELLELLEGVGHGGLCEGSASGVKREGETRRERERGGSVSEPPTMGFRPRLSSIPVKRDAGRTSCRAGRPVSIGTELQGCVRVGSHVQRCGGRREEEGRARRCPAVAPLPQPRRARPKADALTDRGPLWPRSVQSHVFPRSRHPSLRSGPRVSALQTKLRCRQGTPALTLARSLCHSAHRQPD